MADTNDPTRFIHPIIAAMIANADYQQKVKSQAEEARSNKANEDLRQQQLQDTVETHKNDYNLAKDRLTAETNHLMSLMENEHQERIRGAYQDVQSGLKKPQDIPGALGVQQIPGTDVTGATGSFPTPEEHFVNLGKQAAAVTTATEGAKQPFEQAARNDQFQKAITVANIGAGSKEDVARTVDATKRLIDQNKMDYQSQLLDLKRQSLLQGNTNGDQAAKLYNDVYVTGTTKFSSLNKNERNLVLNSAPSGHTPLDPKDNDLIDNIPKVQDILHTAHELAGYSLHPTSGTVLPTLQGSFGLGGPQQELKDSLKSKVDALVPIFAKVSRFSESTIRNQLSGLYSSTNSPQENATKVAQTEDYLNSIVQPVLKKYAPDQMKQILSNRDIAYKGYTIAGTQDQGQGQAQNTSPVPQQQQQQIPDWLSIAPKINKKGHTLSIPDSIQYGKPVYQ